MRGGYIYIYRVYFGMCVLIEIEVLFGGHYNNYILYI